MASSAVMDPRSNGAPRDSMTPVVVISFVLHVIVLIVVPLALNLLRKPVKFERPKTFQLVQPPLIPQTTKRPAQKAQSKPEPKPPAPTQQKKPTTPAPAREPARARQEPAKPQEENTDDLAALLGQITTPPAQVSAVGDFKYHWYLNSVQQKIERQWRPPTASRDVAVRVSFSIHSDGSISDLSIEQSSGSSVLDNLALRAVTLAAPFGKLPPGFSGNRLDLTCTLRPIGK